MRFLVDAALSPIVAESLRGAGHDAFHVRDFELQSDDATIFDRATQESRILVSADTDFGTILAQRHASTPSLILFRGPVDRRPQMQIALLLANLTPPVNEALVRGSTVVFEETRIRIRPLPIGGAGA